MSHYKGRRVRLTVRIPAELYDTVSQVAGNDNITINDLVEGAIDRMLEERYRAVPADPESDDYITVANAASTGLPGFGAVTPVYTTSPKISFRRNEKEDWQDAQET